MVRLSQGRIKGNERNPLCQPFMPLLSIYARKGGISDANVWRHIWLISSPNALSLEVLEESWGSPSSWWWMAHISWAVPEALFNAPLSTCLLDFQSVTSTGQLNHCKEVVTFHVGYIVTGLQWQGQFLLSPKLTWARALSVCQTQVSAAKDTRQLWTQNPNLRIWVWPHHFFPSRMNLGTFLNLSDYRFSLQENEASNS